ncbi:hypothetical protein [Halapricum hydrolyticum]|uniref:Uncharacterized protein n=1 Tax=Halapricum hydrolyticum TaxID=2979991 RepID=A0AAE3IEE5_9EURY|nr:hypothetical protein [Halapricum hydrolyticum]MCU4717889.1 hypothetical protein [Halapricum hydrolyticum]MCU4727054.1 hypothetical protein [Halapricum hydrolyticum]
MDESDFSSELQDRLDDRRAGSSKGTLALSEQEGYVGDELTLLGRNLSADEQYDLVWHTSDGRWAVIEANRVVGPQYSPRTEPIATVRTDESGEFDETWTIPEDYGGSHKITVENDEGVAARAEFEVRPWFELDRTQTELGEAFVVRGYGIGPSLESNNFQIAWDNQFVGFITGVINRGTATARIRAVGPPGEHVIQVWRNYRGVPFVANNTQSPLGSVGGDRANAWTVEVTEPDSSPPTMWVDELFEEQPFEAHYPELDADTEAELEIAPQCGPAGTQAIITGRNFPPNAAVDLKWYQHVGEGIRGLEVTPTVRPGILPTVTADADGRFQVEFEIPPAEGSTRPILAEVDGRSVAATGFMMQPSIETFEPTSGPVGTEIEIELSGIGWTAYESAPFFVYDNAPLGYACGTSEDLRSPTVRTVLQATGEPGYHFIDVYPSIFEMEDDEPEFEIRPHLSYLDNHPVRPLPACHMVFEVTEE